MVEVANLLFDPPQPTQEVTVRLPMVPELAKRLVVDEFVEKKLVVVAEVPVAVVKVND